MHQNRRNVLKAGGIGLLGFKLGGVPALLTPGEAHAQTADFEVLTVAEIEVLEALGEVIVPGAREAGLSNYIDNQLAVDSADSLLMIRYLDVPPPYLGFYRAGLAALDAYCTSTFEQRFPELPNTVALELVGQISRENPDGWQGPPAPFVYFVIRSDAVDVVYGTPEGFEKLGIPYMPHIVPPSPW